MFASCDDSHPAAINTGGNKLDTDGPTSLWLWFLNTYECRWLYELQFFFSQSSVLTLYVTRKRVSKIILYIFSAGSEWNSLLQVWKLTRSQRWLSAEFLHH
jgi:hypothetical protein